MNTLIKLLLSCILIITVQAANAQEWVKFDASQDMKFSMLFPQQPQQQEQVTQSAAGPLKIHMVMLDFSNNTGASNMLYMASYTLLPDSINSDKKEMMDPLFTNSINGMAKNVQGTVKSTKTIAYKGFPGREAKVDVQGQAIITARIYLIHNRLYMAMVFSASGKDDNADAAKFLDSFESE